MYTAMNSVYGNDTGTPLLTVCKPSHFIKEVVGARSCRNWGEPLHICEMSRRCGFGTQEDIVKYFTGDLENDSNLHNLLTCIPVSLCKKESQ